MTCQRIHLERLLGKRVCDAAGKSAGHIEEVVAHRAGDELVIDEFLLGRRALVQRLSLAHVSSWLLSFIGARGVHASHRVPWDKLDLSDPEHPKLTCHAEEVEEIPRAS